MKQSRKAIQNVVDANIFTYKVSISHKPCISTGAKGCSRNKQVEIDLFTNKSRPGLVPPERPMCKKRMLIVSLHENIL